MCGFIWGGMHGFIQGHAWFYSGESCVVLFRGACMVLFGGHAWFYSGACVVLFGGGVCGFIRGVHGFSGGACVVFPGGHAWFFWGGRAWFSSFFGYNEIQSMSGRYASYWNEFLFLLWMGLKCTVTLCNSMSGICVSINDDHKFSLNIAVKIMISAMNIFTKNNLPFITLAKCSFYGDLTLVGMYS